MQFGGVNWLAIFIAAAAGYGTGAVWYWIFGKRWMAANGLTEDMLKEGGSGAPIPYILAAIANVLISIGFAGLLGHMGIGQTTLRNAIITAVALWLAFVLSTMMVNYSFARRPPVLLAIDSGHWLAVMVAMGVILGLLGA
jgi:Protein of unknown function (DUF1761)